MHKWQKKSVGANKDFSEIMCMKDKTRNGTPAAGMQHQLQRCSTSCKDVAPTAEMQHQLQRCSTNHRDALPAAGIHYQLHGCKDAASAAGICSTSCMYATPATGSTKLQRCITSSAAGMEHQQLQGSITSAAQIQHQHLKCSTSNRVAAPSAEMQHQQQRCSTSCRDAAPAAKM